jgi:hypothetical protein
VHKGTGSLDLFFLSLAGVSVLIAAVALLLPSDRSMTVARPQPQPQPAE